MKIKKATKIFGILQRIFKIREWVDFYRIKAATLYIFNIFKQVFIPQKRSFENLSQKQEVQKNYFNTAVKKMNLTEENLAEKQTSLLRLSLLMSVFSLSLTGYGIYQLLYGTYRAFLVTAVLALVALTLAFRYHFWYFQIKERRLGCTIREWFESFAARGKK